MKSVGLTGGIASGKSTVCGLLREKGCTIVDADAVGHQLLRRGAAAYLPVVQLFGSAILMPSGEIDRSKLGDLVFSSPDRLSQLDQLMHPLVIEDILGRLRLFELESLKRVVVDASLMIESGFHRSFQRLILVTCSGEQQIERLMARNHLTESQAERRIGLQMPLAAKRPFATDIIDNSGTIEQTRGQVNALFEDLERTLWTTSR